MFGLYPEVGMAGAFTATAPFDTVINARVRYECLAVESLQGMVANGEEPYDAIYMPRFISHEKYQQDLKDNVRIITLQSFKGEILRIPHGYLLSLPDASGIRYSMIMLGVNLSAITEGLDLSVLKTDIAELVLDRVGVNSEIKEVVYGPVTLLTHDQHRAIQSARRDRMLTSKSNLRRCRELERINTGLTERLAMLEKYIEDHYTPEVPQV